MGVSGASMVQIVDDLESRGLLERRRLATDRRTQVLHLLPEVPEVLAEASRLARLHARSLLGDLSKPSTERLVVLMQRLVTSSTRAIITTLEKRLAALQEPGEQLSLLPSVTDEEWNDLDGQDQLNAFLKTRLAALKNERAEVDLLLTVARKVEARGPDAKAEALLEWVYKFQKEEGDPDVKLLVFTEFVPTQAMLADFLERRGFTVVILNGGMDLEERRHAQRLRGDIVHQASL
jgi:DNA-binding MarR family transcriptional regulator